MDVLCSVIYISTGSFLCGYVVFMILKIISLIHGWRWLHSYQVSSASLHSPGVSVIKPLIGFDLNMKENLETFFQIKYPNFELIFCVAEAENKLALGVLNELITQYPYVQVSIYQGGEVVGVNPKINNMLPGYRNAKHDLVWISDSNIKTSPLVLSEMTRHMSDPKTALVHQLPYVDVVEDFPGYLEKVYFGTQHARIYLLASWANVNCANGMSWLIRKKALEQEGGLEAFAEYLAEDFFMGKAMWERGWKFVLSTLPARQNPSGRSLAGYQTRNIRWGRLRSTMMVWPVISEPLTESVLLGAITSFCLYNVFGANPLFFLAFHMISWFLYDILLIKIVECGPVGSVLYIFLAWCLREVWTLPLFLAGLWSREVAWRGQRYRVQFGGKATKLD